jgi:hypothetical protein
MSSENPKSANHRSSGNNAAGDDRDNTDSAKGDTTATGSGHNGSELSSMRIGTSLSSKPTWGTRLEITISMHSRMILALLSSAGILPPPSLVHSLSLCLYARIAYIDFAVAYSPQGPASTLSSVPMHCSVHRYLTRTNNCGETLSLAAMTRWLRRQYMSDWKAVNREQGEHPRDLARHLLL